MALPFSCIYQGSPSIILPPQPATPTLATTGGTIPASTVVNLSVSARVGTTETLAIAAPTVTTGSGTATNTASVTWPLIPGATDYRIYASTAGNAPVLVGTSTTGSFTWTGAAGSSAIPGASGFVEPTLWTAPAGKSGLILGVVASNPTQHVGSLFLARTPAGGSLQRLISGTPVPPDSISGQPVDLARKHAFSAGDILTGYVTVPGIVLTIDALVD